MVRAALPDDPEVAGLLALMLLTEARRAARTGADGELIPLDEQDRSVWDRALIEEGGALIGETWGSRRVGAYQVQAAIAAVHDDAERAEQTDWPEILALYELLERITSNPVVTLNKAVAASMVHGPAAGLALLDSIAPSVGESHRVQAVRGHLLEMLGDYEGAAASYRAAAAATASLPEQQYLLTHAARLTADARPD
jgi:predicted RNA polymerase sigma factor